MSAMTSVTEELEIAILKMEALFVGFFITQNFFFQNYSTLHSTKFIKILSAEPP